MFFSEEKNQKTSISCASGMTQDLAGTTQTAKK
jgi:hypothetical protein